MEKRRCLFYNRKEEKIAKEKWKNGIKKYVAISEKKSSKNIFKDSATNYEVIQEEDVCIYSFEDDEKKSKENWKY